MLHAASSSEFLPPSCLWFLPKNSYIAKILRTFSAFFETTTGCLDTVHTSCWYGNGLMALRGTKEAPKQRKNQTHMQDENMPERNLSATICVNFMMIVMPKQLLVYLLSLRGQQKQTDLQPRYLSMISLLYVLKYYIMFEDDLFMF